MIFKHIPIGGGKSLRYSFLLTITLLLTFAIVSCSDPEGDEGDSRSPLPPDSLATNNTPINVDSVWKDPLEIDLNDNSGQ